MFPVCENFVVQVRSGGASGRADIADDGPALDGLIRLDGESTQVPVTGHETEAVRQDDGSYLITGEKIFITSGDHELTPNIIHAVLARTPGAPAGPKA